MDRKYFKNYFKTYYQSRREIYLNLLGGKCVVCGGEENLEFDHIDPSTKEFNITNFLNYSKKQVLAELAKCQILCNACHKNKTNKLRKHGTTTMYRIGCRCGLCSEANTAYYREYMAHKYGTVAESG